MPKRVSKLLLGFFNTIFIFQLFFLSTCKKKEITPENLPQLGISSIVLNSNTGISNSYLYINYKLANMSLLKESIGISLNCSYYISDDSLISSDDIKNFQSESVYNSKTEFRYMLKLPAINIDSKKILIIKYNFDNGFNFTDSKFYICPIYIKGIDIEYDFVTLNRNQVFSNDSTIWNLNVKNTADTTGEVIFKCYRSIDGINTTGTPILTSNFKISNSTNTKFLYESIKIDNSMLNQHCNFIVEGEYYPNGYNNSNNVITLKRKIYKTFVSKYLTLKNIKIFNNSNLSSGDSIKGSFKYNYSKKYNYGYFNIDNEIYDLSNSNSSKLNSIYYTIKKIGEDSANFTIYLNNLDGYGNYRIRISNIENSLFETYTIKPQQKLIQFEDIRFNDTIFDYNSSVKISQDILYSGTKTSIVNYSYYLSADSIFDANDINISTNSTTINPGNNIADVTLQIPQLGYNQNSRIMYLFSKYQEQNYGETIKYKKYNRMKFVDNMPIFSNIKIANPIFSYSDPTSVINVTFDAQVISNNYTKDNNEKIVYFFNKNPSSTCFMRDCSRLSSKDLKFQNLEYTKGLNSGTFEAKIGDPQPSGDYFLIIQTPTGTYVSEKTILFKN